jgi:hypothetical protein
MAIVESIETEAAKALVDTIIDQVKTLLLHGRSCVIQVDNRTGTQASCSEPG